MLVSEVMALASSNMAIKKGEKIRQINVSIDEEIVTRFRETIYFETGLKKGDLRAAIEEAMLDYIAKHSKLKDSLDFVKRKKKEEK